MRGKTKLHKINIEKTLESINLDSNLRNVLQTEQGSKLDLNEIKEKVKEFSQKTMETLTQNEIKAIDNFYQLRNFEPTLIDEKGILHPKIKDPPAIQRTIQKISIKKKQD